MDRQSTSIAASLEGQILTSAAEAADENKALIAAPNAARTENLNLSAALKALPSSKRL
jgi:hypothetical protein